MKHLLRYAAVSIIPIVCVSVVQAQGRDEQMNRNRARAGGASANESGPAQAGRANKGLYQWSPHVVPFLPDDLVVVEEGSTNRKCDTSGATVKGGNAICRYFTSASTKTKWNIRIVSSSAERIFKTQGASFIPYVQFDGKTVHSASPEAEKFAAAKGYRLDASTHTMVKR